MARVMIGIPVRHIYGSVSPKTQDCLDRLRAFTKNGTEVRLVRGQQITQNSYTICKHFLEENWDYLLYTGDDIVFPPWALDRLLAHDKEFVGGVCTWKTPPYFVPVGKLGDDGKFRHVLIRPEHVANNVLMEVDGVGSGFILVKRSVVQRVWDYLNSVVYPAIPKQHRWMSPIPFFPAVRDPETDNVFSSDFAFCRLARECGTRIFLDCGLICRHRWEGEYDVTDHWEWISKYGFAKTEERFYGDEVPFVSLDEDSVHWGPAGPPVPLTAMSTGNLYHLTMHVAPSLDCRVEEITEQRSPVTNVGYVLGWHVFDDVSWQAYSAWAARYARVLVHWVGSDLMNINTWLNPERLAHMNNPHFIHLVEDERMLAEARQYFEKVQVCALPTTSIFPPVPLPKKFAVAVYYPAHRHDFHYGDVMVEVMKKMPDVNFYLYHLMGNKPKFELPNAFWLGSLEKEQYGDMIANTSCTVRLSKHDGRPYSIVEFAIAGRRFITNFHMPHSHVVSDPPTADEVVKKLREIQGFEEPDLKASRYYMRENDILNFKSKIRKIAGIAESKASVRNYDYTQYWDKRYSDEGEYVGVVNSELDAKVNQIVRDWLKGHKCESMLDVGCGTAERWGTLPIKDYVGVDVSPTAVRRASEKYPNGKFFVADVSRDPLPKADMVVALSLLNHIRPAEFDEVLKKLLDTSKKCLISVVSTGTGLGKYQFALPPLDLWDQDGWKVRSSPLDETGVMLVTFERIKEGASAAKPDRSNAGVQST